MKRAMALDVGFKKIGVAVSDPLRLTARPLKVIYRKSNQETFNELLKIIEEESVNEVVIGVPINNSGEITKIGQKIKRFGEKFEEFLKEKGVEVELYYADESFTTYEAKELARQLNKKEKELDHFAAALLLKEWLQKNS
jgi:putative Holliday junction resolvase